MARTYDRPAFDKLISRIKFVTTNHEAIKAQGGAFFTPTFEDDGTPEHAKAVQMKEVLEHTDFGCQQDYVRQLFEILLGHPIPAPGRVDMGSSFDQGSSYMSYLAVVPLNCPNGHDYALGRISVCLHNGRRAMRHDGTLGNDLPHLTEFGDDKDVRLATMDEIDAWATALWDFMVANDQINLSHPPCREVSDRIRTAIDAKIAEQG